MIVPLVISLDLSPTGWMLATGSGDNLARICTRFMALFPEPLLISHLQGVITHFNFSFVIVIFSTPPHYNLYLIHLNSTLFSYYTPYFTSITHTIFFATHIHNTSLYYWLGTRHVTYSYHSLSLFYVILVTTHQVLTRSCLIGITKNSIALSVPPGRAH